MYIKMWEGACSRWRWVSLHMQWLTLCYREQAPSHIWTVLCLQEERVRELAADIREVMGA